MNYFVGGSTVLQHLLPQYGITPNDLDIFYFGNIIPDIKSSIRIEFHNIPDKNLFDAFITQSIPKYNVNLLTLESLYILKLSHAEYNIKWLKTIQHIQLIKKHVKPFNQLDTKYHDLFKLLKIYWKEVHKELKHVNLNKSKDEFFADDVSRKYDHDSLHLIVAYNEQPLYKNCLKDGHDVQFDENKFSLLSFEDKLKLCLEEIYVIALERFMIPSNFEMNEHEAYRKALKKVVTSMTTGWFNFFILDNYNKLYKFDINYYKLFLSKQGTNKC